MCSLSRAGQRSRVAILTADRYSDALEQLLYDGLKLLNLGVKGKTVLLKPNLVEYSADAAVNTHPATTPQKRCVDALPPRAAGGTAVSPG
jgi:hypothetical protein